MQGCWAPSPVMKMEHLIVWGWKSWETCFQSCFSTTKLPLCPAVVSCQPRQDGTTDGRGCEDRSLLPQADTSDKFFWCLQGKDLQAIGNISCLHVFKFWWELLGFWTLTEFFYLWPEVLENFCGSWCNQVHSWEPWKLEAVVTYKFEISLQFKAKRDHQTV